MRCLVEIEYGENIGHFVEILFGLATVFLKINPKQNQADLDPRSVPAGAGRRQRVPLGRQRAVWLDLDTSVRAV